MIRPSPRPFAVRWETEPDQYHRSPLRAAAAFGQRGRHGAWIDTGGPPRYRTDDKPVVDRWIKAIGKLPD